MTGWTQTPNFIYDLMPDMKEAEIKVVMLIVRQTIGWQRESVSLSVSDFKRATGLAQASVVSGIKAALERGIIARIGDKNSYSYQIVEPKSVQNLNRFEEPVQILNENSSESEPLSVQNLNDTNIKINTSKITETESAPSAAPPLPIVVEPLKPKDHPAVKAYRDLHKRFPSAAQMQIIYERDPPLTDWLRAIRAWAACGFKPTNIEGMLDWTFNPKLIKERPYRNGASNGNHHTSTPGNYQPPATAGFTAEEWAAYLADPAREPSPF
jgi:phage replication O-like protein O